MAMKVVLWRRSTWHRNKIPGSQSCLHNSLTAECIFNHIHHSIQYSPKYIQVPTWDTGRKWQTCLRSILRSKLSSSPQFLQHLQLDWPPVRSQGSWLLKLPKDAKTNHFGWSKDLQRSPKISKVAKIPAVKKNSYLCCSSGCLNLGKFADVRCHSWIMTI